MTLSTNNCLKVIFFKNKIQSQKYFKDSMSIWQLQHNFRFRARTFLKWYTVWGDRRVIERLQLFSRIIDEMNKKIVHHFVCRNVAKRVKNLWYASVYIYYSVTRYCNLSIVLIFKLTYIFIALFLINTEKWLKKYNIIYWLNSHN